MGNDQATLLQKDTNRLNISKYVEISAKHNKKIIHKNIKPFKEFSSIIKSIYVRSTYLKYDWSQWLCTQLNKDHNKIYENYCQMFKISLMKKNETSQNFHIKNFASKFILSLQNHSKKLQMTDFSLFQLEKLYKQVKCYFMIQNWFVDLPLNNYFKNHQATWNLGSKQNEYKAKSIQFFNIKSCDSHQKYNQPEKINRILLKLTEIYFINNYYVEQPIVPSECQSPKRNPMKRFTTIQSSLIKAISKQSSFKQRQILVAQLLDSILKFNQISVQKIQISTIQHKKLYALTRVLGLKNVYCVLKILTQIGSTDHIEKIQFVFNHIQKTMVVPLQKHQQYLQKKSPQKKKTSSPQKRKRNSKIKTEFIR